MKTVVVLGASEKPERMSNTAVKLLKEAGYVVIPINPNLETLEGMPVFHTLRGVKPGPDVLTVYVNPERSAGMEGEILSLSPKVAVFNPGSENPELGMKLREAGIRVMEACTVVLLKTNRFESETDA